MIVRAAADQPVAVALHAIGQRRGILHDLLLIRPLNAGCKCFMEANCFARDHMLQRPALDAGETPANRSPSRISRASKSNRRAGPRNVLCVVVVTKSAVLHRARVDARRHQAPRWCAISASKKRIPLPARSRPSALKSMNPRNNAARADRDHLWLVLARPSPRSGRNR